MNTAPTGRAGRVTGQPLHSSREEAIALHLAGHTRSMSAAEIADLYGWNPAERHRLKYLLAKGRDKGFLLMEGDKRHARWSASPELRLQALRSQMAMPLEQRPRVGYDPGFLAEYKPNQTFYLTATQRQRLAQRCRPGDAVFTALGPHDQSLFLCGLSFASSSLEGNGYDLAATEKLLLDGMEKEGASSTETTMILNPHDSVRYLVDNITCPPRANDVCVSSRDIKTLHGILSADLLKDPMMCGNIRTGPVLIKHSSYIPLSIGTEIERAMQEVISKATLIADAYEQSFFLLVHLPYLQPFEDCNKRTARVACNIPLLRGGIVPMSWMDISQASFIDGLMGVYERCNSSLLAEVFTDGYLRSIERFDVMRRSCEPDPVAVMYRSEIRSMVRSVVLDGPVEIPAEIEDAHRARFIELAQVELDLLRKAQPGAIVRMRLGDGDVARWRERELAAEEMASTDEAAPFTQDESGEYTSRPRERSG